MRISVVARRVLMTAAVSLTCAITPGVAAAQDQSSSPATDALAPKEGSANTLTDIVVTARRKAERLQDVPVTLSAFSGKQLERAGAVRADDIAALTPGLTVGSFTPSRPQVFIRGIGTRQIDIGSDPSIGIFVDDVYVSRISGQMTGLADLERVEVLKGPQGTLYGRKHHRRGDQHHHPGASQAVQRLCRRRHRRLRLFRCARLGICPLIHDLAYGRVSFFRTERDGYIRNLATGGRAQGLDQYDIRGKLLLTRGGPLSVTFTVDVLRDRSPGQEGKSLGPDVFLRNPLVPIPVASPDPLAERYTVDSTTRQNIEQYISRIDWQRGIHIASITAYRASTLHNDGDVDYTILDSARQTTGERSTEFSQEIRISSEKDGALTFGNKIAWIAGLYYLHDQAARTDLFTWGKDSLPVLVANYYGVPLTSIGNSTTLDRLSTSYAAFAEITWKPLPQVEVITGARLSRDSKGGHYTGATTAPGFPVLTAPFSIPLSRGWNAFTPRVTVDWHASRDVMLFATYSEGFKSGGFQFAVSDPVLAAHIFDPKRSNSTKAA